MKTWLALVLIVTLITTAGAAAAGDFLPVNLLFNDQKAAADVKAVAKGQVKYVNLNFINKYAHAVTDWDPNKGELFMRFGKLAIKLYKNETVFTIDKEKRTLNSPPLDQDGQVWLPVEFLTHLGLTIRHQTDQELNLAWAENYLLDLEDITYQGRPAFTLVGAVPLKPKCFLLNNPARLVMDLAGVKVHPAFDNSVNQNQVVSAVRFHQSNPESLRLVFDLTKLTGYKLITSPENENLLTLVFNYFVEAVTFGEQDGERKIAIKTSFPSKYTVTPYKNPYRLAIDFEGATLGEALPAAIPGDGTWLKGVRTSQYNQNTVRVVLDMADNAPCFVFPSRINPQLIEIRTIQTVQKVDWIQTDTGGKLVIEADSGLLETIRKLRQPDKLQIDLDYARFDPEVRAPSVKTEQIKGVKISAPNANTARIEVNLTYYVGYTAEFSTDRRKLTISFRRSPVLGKTIVLDPGHGGVDPGATGRQGTREKDINFEVTMKVKSLLEEAGARIVLTRTDDSYVSLYERSFIANYLFADLFVSIHTNNHTDYKVKGIEVYHLPSRSESRLLAIDINRRLTEYTGLTTLGVKTNDFVVIRETQMPSALVELGYLSNYQEENVIRTPEFREKAAQGIFRGIMEFYQR